MKVKSLPHLSHQDNHESGIKRVVEAYFKYLPDYDIELVGPDDNTYDLLVAHAGMGDGTADVAHLHGLYWTADYEVSKFEFDANRRIVNEVRQAKRVTVPSSWVAETFQRDMRFTPNICGHGIEWDDWQHDYPNEGYVLWNKNRVGDVCDSTPLDYLSEHNPSITFVSTYGKKRNNAHIIIGEVFNNRVKYVDERRKYLDHPTMKRIIQQAGVYLSTTKETFGIGTLEAMASGVPILGWAKGGNLDLVQHGINGYLATGYEDLQKGLIYCIQHRDVLGDNGREMAKDYTWSKAVEKVAGVYRLAMERAKPTVSVVIPVYNKSFKEIERAVESCLKQTLRPSQIFIIDDGSNDDTAWEVYDDFHTFHDDIRHITQDNQGVAHARNNGIALTNSKYICCLDADDWLEPTFLEACVAALEKDRSLGIAFTHLQWHSPDGTTGLGGFNAEGKGEPWPPFQWDYDRQINYKKRLNQIPTCAVFKREMWERLGGYRQRYSPQGAGAEDAEFWARAGSIGYKAEKVTQEPLFNYSAGGQVSGDRAYREVDWLAWHPWAQDKQHPFASQATPKLMSHPVRQYDEPVISVIIPVGPGHEQEVINALDSLEAQTFRKWEVVVVFDPSYDNNHSEALRGLNTLEKAYPYKRWIFTSSESSERPLGAGYARNRGAEIARAPLLLFLDADDTLHPDCLQEMLDAYYKTKKAVYTDYVRHAEGVTPEYVEEIRQLDRLEEYDQDTGKLIINSRSFKYDCDRAQQQPEIGKLYHWCLITTLVPKIWHDEIGGFDETMETWEDIDYWWRLARAGKCFYHLEKKLVRYRTYTGTRRDKANADTEHGRQVAQSVLQYLIDKYKDIEPVVCNCPDNNKSTVVAQGLQTQVSGSDFIKARYLGPKGNHHVIGAHILPYDPGVPSRKAEGGFKIKYGYMSGGAIRRVHREDLKLMVNKWEVIPETPDLPVAVATPDDLPMPVPEPLKEVVPSEFISQITSKQDFDLQLLPGINAPIAQRMANAGLDSKEAIVSAGVDGLLQIKGVAERRAKAIIKAVEDV